MTRSAIAGLGSWGFMSAETQEATGMSDGLYETLLVSTAGIATLGTFASSVAYGFNIKSINEFGEFSKYGHEGYYGIRFTTGAGKTRVLTLHTHSHVKGKTISQWHWQLQKWNPRAKKVAGTISSWFFLTLLKMRG